VIFQQSLVVVVVVVAAVKVENMANLDSGPSDSSLSCDEDDGA
ncbi:unnamed protein product, partial [Musa acuminata subsp. burmannicoides]